MAVTLNAAFKYDPNQVINGTFGELSADGKTILETVSSSGKIEKEYSDVDVCGTLMKGQKLIGISISGEFKTNYRGNVIEANEIENLAAGKDTSHELTSKLADPAAFGGKYDYVRYMGVKFKEIQGHDWEAGKLGERTYSWTATGMQLINIVEYTY